MPPLRPAAARNRDPILRPARHAAAAGPVDESGERQRRACLHIAAAFPELTIQRATPMRRPRQPTMPGSAARARNKFPALALRCRRAALGHRPCRCVLCINMIHIAPWAVAKGWCAAPPPSCGGRAAGAVRAVSEGGAHTARPTPLFFFDAELRDPDPRWGVRDWRKWPPVPPWRASARPPWRDDGEQPGRAVPPPRLTSAQPRRRFHG